jgi:hypothetical protein
MFNPLSTSIEYVSRAGKLRALAVTTMSRAALLQRPSMQSPKSDQDLTALCAGCSHLARRLSDPAPACMGKSAYVTKPEQPRNLRARPGSLDSWRGICSKSPEHDADHGEADECSNGRWVAILRPPSK